VLTVAIHDVAPSTLGEVEWLLERLDALGISRRVLKVVPAEPGAATHDAPLLRLLDGEVAAGSELVLHGWSHRADGPPLGRPADRLRARAFGGGAAEFLSLSDDGVRDRVAAGREWLTRHDLTAQGFCPPGWLATPALPMVLRDAGFGYVVTLRGLRDLRRGRWLTLPPRGYMGAGPNQERMVALGGAVLSRPLGMLLRAPAHRFFLHPQGASSSAACAGALAGIASLARTHRPATYSELLDG
jgi:predicted deacetylase